MVDAPQDSSASAEKAYAMASAQAKPVVKEKAPEAVTPPVAPVLATPVAAKPVVAKPVTVKAAAPKPAPIMKKTTKAAPKKAAVKKTVKPAAKPVVVPPRAKVAKPATKVAKVRPPVRRKLATPPKFAVTSTVTELKEKIMATAKTTDFTKPINDAIGEFQTKAKVAYDKSTAAMTEATEFAKGNVEALVESSKIVAGGAQDLGKTLVNEAKSAYETMTGDLKEMAAIKSPTELFQLQGKIMRRNFDAMVATSSKNSETMMKLANDAFAPITGRVTVAAEKLSKVA